MSTERAEEALEMAAKIDGEQSAAEEQPKEIAKIDEGQIIKKDEETGEISVQNWLIEALATIDRIEMVESGISTSCQAFKQLCWPKLHGNVKPHMVEWLCIEKERDQSVQGAVYQHSFVGLGKMLPIPKVPPPEYILGFKCIFISFLDDRVMEFIKLIAPISNYGFSILTAMNWSPEDERTKAIRQLLNVIGDKIIEIVNERGRIQNFNRLFPGIIDQKQIKRLGISPDELKRKEDFDIPFNWLMNEQQSDEQKILNIGHIPHGYAGVDLERIKEAFLKDTDRHNWFVFYHLGQPDAEFTVENEKTGEILHLYANEKFDDDDDDVVQYNLLIRCPKGEEDRWKKEGKKKTLEDRFAEGTSFIVIKDDIEVNMNDENVLA